MSNLQISPKRIWKYLAILAGFLLLTACGGNKNVLVKETEHIVVMPSENLLTCPEVPPIPETYTQKDAADLMAQLYARGEQCKDNLDAVRRQLEKARETYEKRDKDDGGFLGL